MATDNGEMHFDINAAVVFRLGEELITDVVQALVELVKNCYDADATWVNVKIDTQGPNDQGQMYTESIGTIVVEDNGHGMDTPTIRRGWLTIADSPKKAQKAKGQVTPHGRTPTGDKGLGRLGSQRLAWNVEIVTQTQADQGSGQYVGFSWRDFIATSNLGDVPVTQSRIADCGKRPGTKLILSDLRDPEMWQTEEQLGELQRKLSGMISPFEEARDFQIRLEVDGKRLELAEITKRVRETALLKYVFEFDGENYRISGLSRLKYLRPISKADRNLFEAACKGDDGQALFEYLRDRKAKGRPPQFRLAKEKGWFVEFGIERALDDVDNVRRIEGSVVNPGPFRGEVDAVSLDSADVKELEVGRVSEYRQLVGDLAGIRVYRDGFGIRVGEDWLGLGRQWTGGGSYYGLRPGNVLGYVAISARDNPDLKETTSREGFQDTPHYENFFSVLTEFVRFAGESQEFVRRGVLGFLQKQVERNAGVEPEDEHSVITQRIDDIAGRLSSQQVKLQQHVGSLGTASAGAAKTLSRVRSKFDKRAGADATVSKALNELEGELERVSTSAAKEEQILSEVSAALEKASELKSTREVLDQRWEALNNQVSMLYESISLGLTAEALSHEIHNIADRLARRSSALLGQLKKGVRRSATIAFIEEVRSSIAAMRKQLAHLSPSLRYLREQRERIELVGFLKDLAEFHEAKLAANNIKIFIQILSPGVAANVNRGKLTQIFDNLILNAEYWLKEAIRAHFISEGEMRIVVDGNYVRVSDNGRGVEESVEETLFEPFVTMKRKGEGRGLGLFVCQQLLDSESCEIRLLAARNDIGRRYVFELDLSGVIDG